MVGVLLVLSILGFIVLAQGEPINSDKTVTLGADGAPEIVTISCIGKGIGRVGVVRDRDGATAFTAKLKPGATPRPSISLGPASDPDYDKAFPLGPLDPDTIYVPRVLDDEHGIGIGIWEAAFKPSALRAGAANGGFSYDRVPNPSTPLDQWRREGGHRLRCG